MTRPKLSRRQQQAENQRVNDARAVLAHAPTMRFICNALAIAGTETSPFDADPYVTAYRAGRAETGRDLIRGLEAADPDARLKLQQFAAKERAKSAPQPEENQDDD